jgi:hypothetical protein
MTTMVTEWTGSLMTIALLAGALLIGIAGTV